MLNPNDNAEDISAHEIYKCLDGNGYTHINGEFFTYDDVLELLDDEEFESATENEIIKMMIDKIAELQNA